MQDHTEQIERMERSLEDLMAKRAEARNDREARAYLGGQIHQLQIDYHEATGRYYRKGQCLDTKQGRLF